MSNSSEMFSTRNTPARWKAACNTSSLPVKDPVCDAAALAAAAGPARLDDDDGLGQRHFAGRRQERAGVADGFHVNDDAARVGIVAQVKNQVAPADIHHRADGNKGAEADIFLQAPIQHRRAKRAALADEPDAPGPGHARGKGGVQLPSRAS